MRKLKTTDVFDAARIIKKANLRAEMGPIMEMVAAKKGATTIEEIGLEGALAVIEVLTEKKSEQAFYDFLAGPFEMTSKEVADLDIETLFELLGRLSTENNLMVFIKALQKLTTK